MNCVYKPTINPKQNFGTDLLKELDRITNLKMTSIKN